MNPASISDLEARWRLLSSQEALNAQALLDDAWALLLSRRPGLEVDLEAGSVVLANVVRVVSQMVLRVLRNPEGKLEESIDDYRYRRDSVTSTGALMVTEDELASLRVRAVGRRNSIRLVTHGDR